MAEKGRETPKGATAPAQTQQGSRRTDYQLKPTEVPNGNRRPVEVHQFSETMRHWREQSSQSKLLVS